MMEILDGSQCEETEDGEEAKDEPLCVVLRAGEDNDRILRERVGDVNQVHFFLHEWDKEVVL